MRLNLDDDDDEGDCGSDEGGGCKLRSSGGYFDSNCRNL